MGQPASSYLLARAAKQAMHLTRGDVDAACATLVTLLATDRDLQEYIAAIAVSEIAIEWNDKIGRPAGEA